MITVKIGDLFESNAQTFINTVNLVGIMGKGIALEFKKRYPEMFKDYVARCKRHEVKLEGSWGLEGLGVKGLGVIRSWGQVYTLYKAE